jgi:hypothetical protein
MLLKMIDHLMHGPNDLWATLESLAVSRAPVRIEIENSLERFTSRVALSKDSVVFQRPERDTLRVQAGDHIRAFLPGDKAQELRLEVVAARMKLAQGGLALQCKPSARIVSRRRAVDRYNVRKYSNLHLTFDGEQFRVIDISAKGCKLMLTPMQSQGRFPVGDQIWYAALQLGQDTTMRLDRLIPRNHAGRMIGCEFQVKRTDASDVTLTRLIASLDKAQDRRAAQAH